ncbi:exonuclease SbcCD subunit D C-terminal domain-containing protein [Haliangium ochraceum]|uniref:Nuclease SbcCD subunit D n=1 Tax=Haliangium ochraceum (strain DSM 14365 / JCM 11303 / SMP-2) TaxID=502025 RepID=D0LY15_HALO1|nr:exonuclease SbcCD subunit D C-terminal domain-containing protein [Haliangium ochraceum]ACY14370.1 nuclease SbcCD, D subunit [Haliangium ochraceum DSM 14365]
MRLLHTSDWHLGHSLHDVSRDYEHECFLRWLVDTLEAEAVDALLITGDIFDSANPPATAQASWYQFLAEVHARLPGLDVLVIGGNHDSAARLEAPKPVLSALRTHVIGALRRGPRDQHGRRPLELERAIVPLRDRDGEVAAIVAAVPFLRTADLPRPRRASADATVASEVTDASDGPADSGASDADAGDEELRRDPLIGGVRQVYAEVLDAARARLQPGQALLATGHCYMVGTDISTLSERRILGGNQHALPVSIFPDDVAYAALGHLHKAQRVGGREGVRYAGSPIPLALDEARYRHQVLLVELEGPALAEVRSLSVPRTVDIVRIPKSGAASPKEVFAAIEALPAWTPGEGDPQKSDTRPFLELSVAIDKPRAQLKGEVEDKLRGKWPRLAKLGVVRRGDGAPLADALPTRELRELDPEEVFLRRYARDHAGAPDDDLLQSFHRVLEDAYAQRGDQAPARGEPEA